MSEQHTREEINTFTNGDQRMLYAARRDTGELFYLVDGEADLRREFTRQHLRCVVPSCPSPELTTVARRDGRRQGFRHLTKVTSDGHAEGLFHRQAKAALVDWLRRSYSLSQVAMEVPLDANRTRIADVMITGPGGARVAFETQYAALSASEWEARHRDYESAGVTDVWLFGHVGDHLKITRDRKIQLNAVHRAAARAGSPLLWFNPIEGTLATISVKEHFPAAGLLVDVAPTGHAVRPHQEDAGTAHLFPLTELQVGPHGVSAPILTSLAQQRAAAEAAERDAVARENALTLERARREAAVTVLMERVRQKASDRQAGWATSTERNTVFAHFNGRWPAFLGIRPRGQDQHHNGRIYLPFPDEQWQALLYLRLMHGQPDRTIVTMTSCVAYLNSLDADVRLAKEAVAFWFHRMADLGVMEKVHVAAGDSTSLRYAVRDPRILEEERAQARTIDRERRQAKQQQAEDRKRERAAAAPPSPATVGGQETLRSIAERRATGSTIAELPPPMRGHARCHGCFGGLSDPLTVRLGYHLSCAHMIPG